MQAIAYQPGFIASPFNSKTYDRNVIIIPGFLTENMKLSHGAHNANGMDLATLDWMRHFEKTGDQFQCNVYSFNWPAGSDYELLMTLGKTVLERIGYVALTTAITLSSVVFPPLAAVSGTVGIALNLRTAYKLKKIASAWQQAVTAADSQALELVKIINQLGGETHVIGHSLGGRIAVRLLENHSKIKLRKLYVTSLAPAITDNDFKITQVNPNYKGEVFYSKHDTVLQLLYKIGELALADPLGYIGPNGCDNHFAGIDVSSTEHCTKMRHHLYEKNLPAILALSSLWKAFTAIPDSDSPNLPPSACAECPRA